MRALLAVAAINCCSRTCDVLMCVCCNRRNFQVKSVINGIFCCNSLRSSDTDVVLLVLRPTEHIEGRYLIVTPLQCHESIINE